jgi:hypothetical protein
MCELYSYRKIRFDIKITWAVCDSYVLFEEASPCFLEDVYEVLIFFYRFSLRVYHTTRDRSILIESKIQ